MNTSIDDNMDYGSEQWSNIEDRSGGVQFDVKDPAGPLWSLRLDPSDFIDTQLKLHRKGRGRNTILATAVPVDSTLAGGEPNPLAVSAEITVGATEVSQLLKLYGQDLDSATLVVDEVSSMRRPAHSCASPGAYFFIDPEGYVCSRRYTVGWLEATLKVSRASTDLQGSPEVSKHQVYPHFEVTWGLTPAVLDRVESGQSQNSHMKVECEYQGVSLISRL